MECFMRKNRGAVNGVEMSSVSSRSHTGEELTSHDSSSLRSDSPATSSGSSDSPTEGSTISSPRPVRSESLSSNSNTNNESTASDSPSVLSSAHRLFSSSPKTDEWLRLEFLDWMNSVIDYCRKKSSQITIPEEREKFVYAKACYDWGVNVYRSREASSDPDFGKISKPSRRITQIYDRFKLLKSGVTSNQGSGIINFDSLKQSLIDKIEHSKNNYQGLERFKYNFLKGMAEILKRDQIEQTIHSEINHFLEELKQKASKVRRLHMQAVRGQHSWAAAVCMPSNPLDGTQVRQIYNEVCLLCELQRGSNLVESLPDIINKLQKQLIKEMNDYSSQADKVSEVKRSFMQNLEKVFPKDQLASCNPKSLSECEDSLKRLPPKPMSLRPDTNALVAYKLDPFSTSFFGSSRVKDLYTRSCDLIECVQSVCPLLNSRIEQEGPAAAACS